MDINIPFPQAFKDWSRWIQLSTLDVQDIFNLNSDYKLTILFSLIMLVPALFLALYFYFDRMRSRQDEWASAYVDRWDFVKWRTFVLYLCLILASTACCFSFIDHFDSLANFKHGEKPTPASLTWAIILFCAFTFCYWVWFRIVRMFQRHWAKDESAQKQAFKAKWLNMIHWAQIVFLFAITSLYLPVSRVILMQFACDKETNPEVYQSLVYPGAKCFPDEVTGIHYASYVTHTHAHNQQGV